MSLLTPEGVTYGLVLGRWVQIIGDTSVDPDKLPDTIPVKGSILFTRKQKTTARLDTTQTDGTYVGIAKQNVTGYLRTVDGELAPAVDSEDTGLWLVTGIYTVIFTLSGTTWPSFDIEVTAAHTAEAPLDLISASPYVAPVGATPVVIMVPASIPDGYLLAKNGASFTGIDPATLGGAGATPDASETVKGVVELATSVETVTGDDATRATTPAGVKAALDAKAASDMSTFAATSHKHGAADIDSENAELGYILMATGSGGSWFADMAEVRSYLETAHESGAFFAGSVSASGAARTLAVRPAHRVVMNANCTFTFANPTYSNGGTSHAFFLHLSGAFTPTFPASVSWVGGSAPTYNTAGTVFRFLTLDAGTTWLGWRITPFSEAGADGADTSGQFATHTLTPAASVTLSADYPAQSLTMTSDTTLVEPTISDGTAILFWLSGEFTPTWWAGIKWAGGTAPTYDSGGTLYHLAKHGAVGWLGSGQAYS